MGRGRGLQSRQGHRHRRPATYARWSTRGRATAVPSPAARWGSAGSLQAAHITARSCSWILFPSQGFSMRGTLNPTQSEDRGSYPLHDLVAGRLAGVRCSQPLRHAWADGWGMANSRQQSGIARIRQELTTSPRSPHKPIPAASCAVWHDQEIVMRCSDTVGARARLGSRVNSVGLVSAARNAIKTAGHEPVERSLAFARPVDAANRRYIGAAM